MGMKPPHSVLVVDDDPAMRTFLAEHLVADSFVVWTADGAGEGLRAIEVRSPSIVVLDLLLGDGHGLDVLDRVRASDGLASRIDPGLPVIVLSGRGAEVDRTRSLRRGADDHVSKPFSYPELVARIDAVLRRAARRPLRGTIRVGELTIDPASRVARMRGVRLDLSTKEFGLLLALAGDPFRVFGKRELLRDVWGFRAPGETRTLDAHACRLRKKLRSGDGRLWVLNVRGIGYRLTDAP
jgi:DNA-binding response OmpR family regulator